MIRLISRDTGEPRVWVCDRANRRTCADLIAETRPLGTTQLSTDEWRRDRGRHPSHATVQHGSHEGARETDGDGLREVHGHTCEGAGAALRTDRRVFRGVHQPYWHLDVATYEAVINAKRVTPPLIRRMCLGNRSAYTDYT